MSPVLGKINDNIVPLDIGDPPHPPGPVIYEVPLIKGNMFLKVRDGFMDIPPVLAKIGDPDIFFQLAVMGIFLSETLGNTFSRLIIPLIIL